VIGGWLTFVGVIFIVITAVYLGLLYSDPRGVTLVPFLRSSDGHSMYQRLPHQVQLRFQVLIQYDCPPDPAECKRLFNLQPDNLIQNYNCTKSITPQTVSCLLMWDTPVLDLYNHVIAQPSGGLNLTFTFNQDVGTLQVYTISSKIAFDSNFHSHTRTKDILTWAYHKSRVNTYIFDSFVQCYSPLNEEDMSFSGYFRRIHYSPLSTLTDRFTKDREILAHGVSFTELRYPYIQQLDQLRVIQVLVTEEDLTWYVSGPSVVDLILKVSAVTGAALTLPPAIKQVAQNIVGTLTAGAKGCFLTVFIVTIPFAVVVGVINIFIWFHPEEISSELYNGLWVLLIIFGSICLTIIIRLFWGAYSQKKKYRRLST